MSSFSRIQLEAWLKTISPKGRVLDIGGSQLPIKGRTRTWEVESYTIIDLPQPHEEKEKAKFSVDIQEPKGLVIRDDKGNSILYDTAFCIELAEYWYDPLTAIRNINMLMEKGGVLYISFHFVYPIHNPESEDCLRYTRSGARKLLEKNGFSIEEIKPRYFSNYQYAQMLYDHENMKGLKVNKNIINKEQGYLIKARKL